MRVLESIGGFVMIIHYVVLFALDGLLLHSPNCFCTGKITESYGT